MNEQSKKQMAEVLWMEINRAIFNSNRVRDCLNSLKEKNLLDDLSQHDFLLDGEKLIEEILDDSFTPDDKRNDSGESFIMFLRKQGPSIPSVKATIFHKGHFSIN